MRVVVLLCLAGVVSGCAAARQVDRKALHPSPGEDCGFRSANTCWTLAPSFPQLRTREGPALPQSLEAPTAVALQSDTVLLHH
jgi:hypothetical protein